MVNAEASATEVVGRGEEGENRKKRKRVKDGGDSVVKATESEVGCGVGSLNRTEAENLDSSNETRKKKKEKKKKQGNDQEVINEEFSDPVGLARDDQANGEKVGSDTVTETPEPSNDSKKEKKKKRKRNIDKETEMQGSLVGDNELNGKDIRHEKDSTGEIVSLKKRGYNQVVTDEELGNVGHVVGDDKSNEENVSSVTLTENSKSSSDSKKKKKKEKKKHGNDEEVTNDELGNAGDVVRDDKANEEKVRSGTVNEYSEPSNDGRKDKKKKKRKHSIDQEAVSLEVFTDETVAKKKKKKKAVLEPESPEVSAGDNEANRKGTASKTSTESSEHSEDIKNKEKKKKRKKKQAFGQEGTGDPSDSSPPKTTSKRVSFSEDVVVFPIADETTSEDKELVRGKRFTPDEDNLVKAAVWEYIDSKGLGDEGLKMILNCKKHKQVKNCWKEIGAALPWRPYGSVYYRAHILFERDGNCKWTEEERELVLNFHKKHGSDWKTLAEALGKHRVHVKDAFRRLRLQNQNSGQWSQDEYQTLFELVNTDLRMKVLEERKSKHGMLRDNISWTAISEKLDTRNDSRCCIKWYKQLASPMVAEGTWLDTDDYRLVIKLYNLDACCMEDVEWEELLEHRTGDVCRKRWNQMVKHLGDCSNKTFAEQVEILAKRYCPDVLQAREAYYSKPLVD